MNGRAELFRSLGMLCERPAAEHGLAASALRLDGFAHRHQHTDAFLFQLYPYASVYVGEDGMLGGEARDRVSGFWRALGLIPPAEPDHLAALLFLYAGLDELTEREDDGGRRDAWGRAKKALLWEHILSWVPPYLEKMSQIAAPFYVQWARLLETALVEEAVSVGAQDRLPLHLRMAAHNNIGESLLRWLLTPVKSGLVLVRSDLQRAAQDLGLGLRAGERRFALQSLLAQDADATLTWLSEEARRWTIRHERWEPVTGTIADFWRLRAEAAEAQILQCIREAHDLAVGAATD